MNRFRQNSITVMYLRNEIGSFLARLFCTGAILWLTGSKNTAADDTIYVSEVTNTILKISSTGTSSIFATTPGLTAGLALDTGGNLYVAVLNGTIMKFTPAGVGSMFAKTGSASADGLAFDRAGNLYASLPLTNTIMKYTPAGVGSIFASTGLNDPLGLAFDSAGNLFVANKQSNTIEEFSPSGVGSLFASTGLDGPRALAFDQAGNLYASIPSVIERFTPDGTGSLFAIPGGPTGPGFTNAGGLAFDSSDNLYETNAYDAAVEKFTPSGVRSVFASTGSNSTPLYIAIQSVPEPSSLALVASALAITVAGAFARQRNPTLLIRRRRPHGAVVRWRWATTAARCGLRPASAGV